MNPITFIKNFSIYGVGGVVARFVFLFTTPIYTRLLDIHEIGEVELLASISVILNLLMSLEIHSGYARYYYECQSYKERLELRGSVVLFYCVINLFFGGIFFIAYPFLEDNLSIIDATYLVPVFLNILPVQMIAMTLVTLRYEERPIFYSVITTLQIGLSGTLGIISVYYLKLGVAGILWSNVIVSYLVLCFLALYSTQYLEFEFSKRYLKSLFKYCVPITPAMLGHWLSEHFGRIFIASALSLTLLGVYSIALKIGLIMMLACEAFKLTWSPIANRYFSEGDKEERFSFVLDYYLVVSFFIVAGLVGFAPVLVRILAPEPFHNAIGFVAIIAVANMWNGIINVVASGNNWAKKTYNNSIGAIISGALSLILLYLWTDEGGLLFVSLVLLVASITKVFVTLYTAQRAHWIPYSYGNIFISLGLSIVFAIGTYWIYHVWTLSYWILSFSFLAIGVLLSCLNGLLILRGNLSGIIAQLFGKRSVD